MEIDSSRTKNAVKQVKLCFFHHEIVIKASKNLCLELMLFQAHISLHRLKNKYLALTAITHVSLNAAKNYSYIRRI